MPDKYAPDKYADEMRNKAMEALNEEAMTIIDSIIDIIEEKASKGHFSLSFPSTQTEKIIDIVERKLIYKGFKVEVEEVEENNNTGYMKVIFVISWD